MNQRERVFAARAFIALLAIAAAVSSETPALAANYDTPEGYVQYALGFGDTYNGVTTDDGDHLWGSYALKAKVFLGHFAAEYQCYRDLTNSQTNALTPSGGPGTAINYPGAQVIVPQFVASDGESEFRLEYRPPRFPVYLGVAYSNSFNNYNFPRLTASGIGVELQPDLGRALSPYASYYWFPNQTGTYALANPNDLSSGSVHSAFIANELDFGASFAFPKVRLNILAGYYQETNVRKTGTFNFVRDGPYVAVGYRIR
ncbi:MAG: hypothetical protein JO219_12210 [Candidatus Eremiobacteraeota bacterium]|nr:hypothetical protein [Candidatus Eremiobacteraeota bacterium]